MGYAEISGLVIGVLEGRSANNMVLKFGRQFLHSFISNNNFIEILQRIRRL